jgi:hypothetical protein
MTCSDRAFARCSSQKSGTFCSSVTEISSTVGSLASSPSTAPIAPGTFARHALRASSSAGGPPSAATALAMRCVASPSGCSGVLGIGSSNAGLFMKATIASVIALSLGSGAAVSSAESSLSGDSTRVPNDRASEATRAATICARWRRTASLPSPFDSTATSSPPNAAFESASTLSRMTSTSAARVGATFTSTIANARSSVTVWEMMRLPATRP